MYRKRKGRTSKLYRIIEQRDEDEKQVDGG